MHVSVEKYLKLLFKPLHDFFYDLPIISLSRSLVSSSRVLFLAAPHWALGKPVEKVVILEQEKYLPSRVSGVTDGVTGAFDVVASVEKIFDTVVQTVT